MTEIPIEKTIPPYLLVRSSSTTLESKEKVNLLKMLDEDLNLVHTLSELLFINDEIKEYIFKYQTEKTEKNYKQLKETTETLIEFIKKTKIESLKQYTYNLKKSLEDKDIISFNNTLQNLHTEIVDILKNYGIKEKLWWMKRVLNHLK